MAGRVNTKFVVVLIAVLVALPVTLFGYWHLFVRTNPDKLIELADEYLDQGLADQAVQKYAKALLTRTDDVGLMLKFVHALTQIQTSDPRAARGYVGQMIGTLHRAITQEPRNPVPFEKLMQLYMKLGREMNDFESWNRMYEDADARLRAHPDEHGMTLAKKYRGIARVNRMESLDLPADERSQAREDLEETIAQFSDDRDANYYLAAWHILEARSLRRAGAHSDEVNAHFNKANEIVEASLKAYPDQPRRQLDRVRVMSLINRIRDEQDQDRAMRLLAQVEQTISSQAPQLRLILDLVELLPSIDQEPVKSQGGGRRPTTSGMVRAENVLRAAITARSAEPRYMATLARVLEAQGRYEDAMEQYKQVYESEATTSAFEGIQLDRIKAGATVKYVELKLKQVDAMDQGERQAAIEEVELLMSRIVANYGESPQVNLLQGKIAMVRSQWGQASSKLDLASSQFKGAVPEALWLSARAWVQMGELGAATDRLEQLAEVRPDYLPARYELVRLYLRLNQLDEAQAHLDLLLATDPDDHKARRAQADVLVQRGQVDQAIDLYLSLDPQHHPELIPILAGLYMATGDQESAIQILEARFQEVPKDIEVLQALIRVSRDTEQAKQYIQVSRQAGGDRQSLDLLESQFEGKSTMTQVLEQLIDADEVPFRRHLKRYRMFQRLGRQEEAEQELEKAAALEPEHPQIISEMFGQALVNRQWDRAEALAAKAGMANIDMAEGMFYYGRLEAARGQIDKSVANYRRGLSMRKVYSEGWRQLGDVQRIALDWNGAVVAYSQAMEQRPNNIAALTGLAAALHALDKQSESLECLRKAVRFRPGDESLRNQYLAYEQTYGDIKKALDLRKRIAVAEPNNAANLRALAVLLAANGQLKKANEVIDTLVQRDGTNRLNINAAAAVRNIGGDPDGAQTMLQKYVHGLGEKATEEDWMMLARFLVGVGNDEHAMAAYRQAVSLEDHKVQRATREFADLLFEKGQYAEAVSRYELLWNNAPTDERVGNRFVEALLRVNQPERAQEVLKVVTEQHGVNGGTYVLEALIARVQGNSVAAMEALNLAAELDPRRAIIFYQRADLQASDPNLDAVVIADLNRALELDPDLSAARRMLATIRVRRGEPTEAVRELRMLIRRRPRHIAARLQLAGLYRDGAQWELRRALLAESAKLFPKAAVWPQLEAQQALVDQNVPLAIQKLEQAYGLSRSPQTLGELSALLIKHQKPDLALSLLRSEGELVRFQPLLHALRGRALMDLGDSDLANRAFARAIEQSGSFKDIAGVAVQMSLSMGWDKALEQLRLYSDGEQATLINLAIVQVEAERENYDAAMDGLRQIDASVAQQSPERLHYDRLLALVYYQQGQYEQALEVYHRLLDRQPNNLVTLNNTAYLLAESLGRAPEALALSQRAAQLAPDNPLVLDTLGWTLYKTGQIESAQRTLRRSVQIKASPLSCMHLAAVLKEQGNFTAAAERLNQAKELAEQTDDQQSLWLISKQLNELLGNTGP